MYGAWILSMVDSVTKDGSIYTVTDGIYVDGGDK